MTLAEMIEAEDSEALKDWAASEAERVIDTEESDWMDAQDGVDPHDAAMKVTLAADRGDITREQRSWALGIVREVYSGMASEDDE